MQEINNYMKTSKMPVKIGSEKKSVKAILNWIEKNGRKNDDILDLGCGNGHILFRLASMGYASLTGWDYASNSVALCKEICKKSDMNISFEMKDITSVQCDTRKFDIIIDKGTFDAVCLNFCSNTECDGAESQLALYRNAVKHSLKEGGRFFITSCNWTAAELRAHFRDHLEFIDELKYKSISFGGKTGQQISSVVLQRK